MFGFLFGLMTILKMQFTFVLVRPLSWQLAMVHLLAFAIFMTIGLNLLDDYYINLFYTYSIIIILINYIFVIRKIYFYIKYLIY